MSSSDPPAPKRPRTEEDTIVSSEIWYKDRSIVLQAATTQFRVHLGLLAAHSTVFRDMHEMPQPETQSRTVDGCPLVEIQDDPEDVKNLLLVLYSPTLLTQMPLSFPIVAALVRLGSKYDFGELRTVAVKWMHRRFPSSLEEFHVRYESASSGALSSNILFDVLELAIENGIECCLPAIYYEIIRLPKKEWVKGSARPSGTVAHLKPARLQTCMSAFDRLIKAQFQPGYIFSWMAKPPRLDTCDNFPVCVEERFHKLRICINNGSCRYFLMSFNAQESNIFSQCAPCQKQIGDLLVSGRQKGWDDLPGFFDLPAWGELKSGLP
ncbi:BTB domain-containing protein [Mycena indigotica]|uniref:BTB domain-containing protein n=1 Tax=Mycena indigotica TaxID=2126181 RepID=A0A8H6VTK8_9AGAR|nr:BTB domain-containing protein [Mycena indigotica]KAF7293447.1 BTB domain-containing protein [Mycena indigotica]